MNRKLKTIRRKQLEMSMKINEDSIMTIQFTKNLQERLGGSNLSQLSKELSIPRSLLQDWIVNERKPSLANLKHLVSLASYLNLTLEELLTDKQANTKSITSLTFKDESREYRINIERLK
ncbi:MAG: hypothetical protein JNM93_00180 [Bacteriovoracaceae bacterium]|nr:hypothetical protein [Bacteriovoracaceae bacterium]